MFGGDDLIANTRVTGRDELEHFVRARTADQLIGREAIYLTNRGPKARVVGRGVPMQVLNAAGKSLARFVGKPIRVFIRRQLEHVGFTSDLAFATDIQCDIHDAGLRFWRLGHVLPSGCRTFLNDGFDLFPEHRSTRVK